METLEVLDVPAKPRPKEQSDLWRAVGAQIGKAIEDANGSESARVVTDGRRPIKSMDDIR